MQVVSVIVAAAGAFAFGAVWYMSLSRQWIAASRVQVGADGQPANTSKMPFVVAAVAMLAVAGMMRHTFGMAGIETVGKGLVSGLGLGAFVALPWIAMNYAFAARPRDLTLIDGGYAVIGCTIIGTILTLF